MKHKNCIRKLLSFLTIICCLAGSITPVYAADTESTSSVPRVTFTNQPNESPDLFVTKIVENAVSGEAYKAPEHAAYRFVLKLNGEIAKNVEYRILDAEGREIIRKTSSGRKYSFSTDSSGIFTLEAGQTAWFEYVGIGTRYEVSEMDTYLCPRTEKNDGEEKEERRELTVDGGYRMFVVTGEDTEKWLHDELQYQVRSLAVDGYQKKSPSGGSTGEQSILANGTSENFVNRYTGKGTGDKTQLEIEKTVSFLTDYERPETPEFTFIVELDGEPYKFEEFTAVNTETGETRSGTTGEYGEFGMKGGWKAVFEDIPTDVDYRIYEDTDFMPGGWWSTGKTEKKGSTQAPLTAVDFNNSNVSFAVTKRLEDYSKPDVMFRFLLTNENNDALGGVTYYLYNTDGTPVYREDAESEEPDIPGMIILQSMLDTAGEYDAPDMPDGLPDEEFPDEEPPVIVNGKAIETGKTWPNGSFSLKPGQAAVFVGMEPGTSFRVSEVKDSSYTQVLPLPENNGIYSVGDNGQITVVNFVNAPSQSTLSVTKNLYFETGEGPLNEEEFHFILYKRLKSEEEVRKALGLAEDADDEAAIREAVADKVNNSGWILAGRNAILPTPGQGGQGMLSLSGEETRNQSGAAMLSQVQPMGLIIDRGWYYKGADGLQYEVYIPVESQIYSVPEGLSAPNYSTGPDTARGLQAGEFTLKANQTAVFQELSAEGQYIVREIGLTAEYTEMMIFGLYRPIYTKVVNGLAMDEGMLAHGGSYNMENSAEFSFTNSFKPRKIDLHLTKINENDETIVGNEAHFMLYLNKGKENPVLPEILWEGEEYDPSEGYPMENGRFYPTNDGGYYVTENGELTIPNLKVGTYWLYEEKAPSGYRILTDPIEIEVVRRPDGTLEVTLDGRPYNEVNNSVIGKVTVDYKDDTQTQDPEENGPDENDIINIQVRNVEFYELPNSGGMGIYWYSIGGVLLMMAAALILYRNKRAGEVLKD